jgi:hypothetical protein
MSLFFSGCRRAGLLRPAGGKAVKRQFPSIVSVLRMRYSRFVKRSSIRAATSPFCFLRIEPMTMKTMGPLLAIEKLRCRTRAAHNHIRRDG